MINYDNSNKLILEKLTREDLDNSEIYEYIFDIKAEDVFAGDLEYFRIADYYKFELKITDFKTRYKAYENAIEPVQSVSIDSDNFTQFTGQKLELNTTWFADDTGIYNKQGDQACSHPITITKRLVNRISGDVKLELAYKLNKTWRILLVPKSTLASSQNIIRISDKGISVTSENARFLIQYLQELDDLNRDTIPTVQSTSKLGYTSDSDKIFIPYTNNIEFDGDSEQKKIYDSVSEQGDYQTWLSTIEEIRKQPSGKIAIASSAMSPILKPLGIQSSFTHFWSSKSGTGKTILLMGACSLWANPDEYMQNFKMTSNALERFAELFNNAPFIMDELQLSLDQYGNQRFDVYQLAQGKGKGRSNVNLTIADTPTWNNTFVTSGESPLVKDSDGQGAYSRVLDINIKDVLFDAKTGNRIANTLRENFGFAGRPLTDKIMRYTRAELQEKYSEKLAELNQFEDIQEKQRLLGAGLLLADELLGLSKPLTAKDLEPYLRKEHDTQISTRVGELLNDWIGQHYTKFARGTAYEPPVEKYGLIEDNDKGTPTAYIYMSVFNEFMKKNRINPSSAKEDLYNANMIEFNIDSKGKPNFGIRKQINGVQARYLGFKLSNDINILFDDENNPNFL